MQYVYTSITDKYKNIEIVLEVLDKIYTSKAMDNKSLFCFGIVSVYQLLTRIVHSMLVYWLYRCYWCLILLVHY